ncbi:ThiF family adenylyltransferase [Oscillatoria salina]|uniref:ThiF family adenylyltransferase n=1 Tax=Oscillatoria salina TaxID=331517 RepID=UPI0013B82E13|nr:ThiF family adenylyltransferase [Oscillatoria salina]MBZ8179154.1 ThiF family adenylyltransferase [Oscillatoria salina IIICB1]NET88061.1 ThiF family adenylyltransferase [Kamptonema sp. SIO1D9]
MSIFFHEQLYRTPELMSKLENFPVTICGAGALGANLTENLARTGFGKLKVIDRDRIEERNLSTQPYYKSDVGAYKAKILTNSLYRALNVAIDGQAKELTSDNVDQLLKNSTLVVDTFDNSVARKTVKDYCENAQIPGLHVGLASDYAEIIWNDNYRVPSPVNDDVCDYPLARNLVMLAVAIASEVIINFIATGEKNSYTFTLGDFAVKPVNL